MKRTRPAELQEDARESRSREDGWAQWWAHLEACRVILLSLLQTAVSSRVGTHSVSFQNSWAFSCGTHALRNSGNHRVSPHMGVLLEAKEGVAHIRHLQSCSYLGTRAGSPSHHGLCKQRAGSSSQRSLPVCLSEPFPTFTTNLKSFWGENERETL